MSMFSQIWKYPGHGYRGRNIGSGLLDDFHPYSPEAHGIIRCGCGKGVNGTTNVNDEHVQNHKIESFPVPKVCIPYMNNIIDSTTLKGFKNALTDFPEVEVEEENALEFLEDILRACLKFYSARLNIEDGESVFDALFIYPFIKAVADIVANEIESTLADFRPGEVILKSMSNQLRKIEIFKNDRCNYLADGIIKLHAICSL
ncbi:unnamed protein product [Mucor hiemalis]